MMIPKIYKVLSIILLLCFILISLILCAVTLTGCASGHSVMNIDRGVGFQFRIPLVFDLKIGSIDSATALIRGGTTFSANSAKGGGLGSISSGDHFVFSSNSGLTEGYLRDVFLSPELDNVTKQTLADNLGKNQAPPKVDAASAVSVNAAAASGDNPPQVKFATTGFDKVADVAPEVVKPVASTVQHVTSETINAVPKYLKSYQLLIGISGGCVILLAITFGFIFFKKISSKFGKKQN